MGFSIRKRKEYVVLFSIFLITLALRLTTAKYDLLLGADPWYHFKIANILLETGKYPMYEYYSRYPFGEPVASPPGLYYLPVYIYKLIGFTGVSLFRIFQLLPAIIGALSVVPLYLLARELHNKKIGFFTALLFALSPASMERGLAGFYRGDAFMLFTMLFAFYFFVCSMKKNIYFSFPAGLFVFLSGLVWNAWPFVFTVLTLAFVLGMLANYFQSRRSDELIISYAITCGFGLLSLSIFKAGFYRYEDSLKETEIFILGFKFLLIIIASMIILELINKFLKKQTLKPWIPLAFLCIVLVVAYNAGYFQRILEGCLNFLQGVRGIGLKLVLAPHHVWRLGIAEQQPVDLDHLAHIYSVLLIISPIGFFFILKEKLSLTKVFSLVYILISVSLLFFQIRFTFLAAPAFCLLGAFLLYYLLMRDRWKKYISLTLVFSLVFANAYAATNFSSSVEPFVSDDLHEALTWIKQNTPGDSIILSWWDYTGPIISIADRRTVTHTAPSGIVESTSLALRTSNETQALEILKSMNEDFVLRDMKIDYIIIDYRLYFLWPKMLMFEPYVNRHINVENRDLVSSTLHKLYPKKGTENFELVFENRDVRVYRPIFNYTRIVEIEAKRYYSKSEEVKISIKTKSNELENVIIKINVLCPEKTLIFAKEERIRGTSQRDISFILPDESTRGTYTILAELYGPQMKKMHSMKRVFIVIN